MKQFVNLREVVRMSLALATFCIASACNQQTSESPAARGGGMPVVSGTPDDFVAAAHAVMPGVVHIKTVFQQQGGGLFGGRSGPVAAGSGSGVTLTEDGYIATNNHVVEGASRIQVIYPDRRSFDAELVGRDPSTDLALLKVKAKGLPAVRLGNSDSVQVGEWVLAIGYPYSLNTTVTAGIVSAKGRSIGIINTAEGRGTTNTGIESFIQTDAAINPGNSGGALVNTRGELIGINTAIASLTGSYAGYAFAIPVSLAKKILDDLREYKTVQRGVLGVSFPSPLVEDQYLRQQGLDPSKVKGVLITGVQAGSAAAEAGLKEGDIIQSVNGAQLASSAEFSERIARHRPGETITLTYLRGRQSHEVKVKLKAVEETPRDETSSLQAIYEKLGATFGPLTPALKERYDINAGVVVSEVRIGGFFDQLGIPPGTIIIQVNGRTVNHPRDIEQALVEARNSRVQILGIAPDGSRVAFVFSLGT